MNNDSNQATEYLTKLLSRCLEYVKAQTEKLSTASGTNEQRKTCICLYKQILGLESDILILHKSAKCCGGIPILLRSVLETVADLKILSEDPNHLHVMQATSLKQQLNMGQAAKDNPKNPMLHTLRTSDDFDRHYQVLQSSLDSLKSQGYMPIKIWEKFKKADMFDEYKSLYSLFCGDTHADLGTLYRRHTVAASHRSLPGLHPVSLEDSMPDIALSLELLIISSKIIHVLFATGETFEDLEKEKDGVMEMIVSGANNTQDLHKI